MNEITTLRTKRGTGGYCTCGAEKIPRCTSDALNRVIAHCVAKHFSKKYDQFQDILIHYQRHYICTDFPYAKNRNKTKSPKCLPLNSPSTDGRKSCTCKTSSWARRHCESAPRRRPPRCRRSPRPGTARGPFAHCPRRRGRQRRPPFPCARRRAARRRAR